MSGQTTYDPKVAELALDAAEAIAGAMEPPCRVAFEELTAEPGEMPRLMLKPTSSDAVERRYISGEAIRNFPFSATLRVACDSEQNSLDAHAWLQRFADAFEDAALSMDGYSAFRTPGGRQQTVPTCLGRTERFEDWQVTFEVKYKQIIR